MSLLEVRRLRAGYGRVSVLHGIDLDVDAGQCVCVIGPNGAGKSTLLRTISGLVKAFEGRISFDQGDITNRSSAAIAALGIAHVPENRRIFPKHSVEQNLRLGGFVRRRDRSGLEADLTEMFEAYPILRERRHRSAGTLSGGEQQMLAIAMAMMARPRLLMMDEPSLGLAPILVERMFEEIQRLKTAGTTILLVEQLATKALAVADRALVLQLGNLVAAGTPEELENDERVVSAYLGV